MSSNGRREAFDDFKIDLFDPTESTPFLGFVLALSIGGIHLWSCYSARPGGSISQRSTCGNAFLENQRERLMPIIPVRDRFSLVWPELPFAEAENQQKQDQKAWEFADFRRRLQCQA